MATNVLQIRNLSKWFDLHILDSKRIPAFHDVSVDIARGSFVGIAGQSGSGKSSLLKCLFRTYLPNEGSIQYTDTSGAVTDIATADDNAILELRASSIGYVSQFLRPTPRVPAVELAARPLMRQGVDRREAHDRVEDMFDRLQLPRDLWTSYPVLFSGGEQQRVNLARALTADSQVLLLDEPTSALDPGLQQTVVQLIQERKEAGTTMIGIMHDMALMYELADTVVHMRGGKVTEITTRPDVTLAGVPA